MKIEVRVKPGAKTEKVEAPVAQLFGGSEPYKVSVREPAKEGRANDAVIRVLAKHFKVPASQVRILRGTLSRNKLVEISEPNVLK